MTDEDVTVDFREGYGEGLSEGVAMFERLLDAAKLIRDGRYS